MASARSDGGVTRRTFLQRLSAAALAARACLGATGAGAQGRAADMEYRVLGRTGIAVSALGFGSHVTTANRQDPEGRTAQIHKGLELGINLFDIYDHTYHQFDLMGQVLGPVRQEVVISLVSVGPAQQVMQEIEASLRAFGTDTIDLYRAFVWDRVNQDDLRIRIGTLQQAKEQGKVRAIGLTAHDQTFMIEVLRTYPELDYLFFPYNFRHQRFSPVTSVHARTWADLKAAGRLSPSARRLQTSDCTVNPCADPEFADRVRQTGVGLIAIKPFAGGGLLDLQPDDPRLDALRDLGAGLPQAALRFVLGAREIASTIPAMNSIDEVVENVGAVQGDGMSRAEFELLQIYADAAERSGGTYLPEKYRWLERWNAYYVAQEGSARRRVWACSRAACTTRTPTSILFMPDRQQQSGIPEGPTPVTVEGEDYEADFVKIAVNVMQPAGGTDNVLPELLRRWFGEDAGQQGTAHRVVFVRGEDGYRLEPLGQARAGPNQQAARRSRSSLDLGQDVDDASLID